MEGINEWIVVSLSLRKRQCGRLKWRGVVRRVWIVAAAATVWNPLRRLSAELRKINCVHPNHEPYRTPQ